MSGRSLLKRILRDGEKFNMKRIFVSVGMNGREFEDINGDLIRASILIFDNNVKGCTGDVAVVHNLSCSSPEGSSRLWCLGEAIKQLGECDACFFCKGWENYKGCCAEMAICQLYGIEVITEE